MHIARASIASHAQATDHIKVDATDILSHLPASRRCRDLGFDGRRTVDSTQVLVVDTNRSRCDDIAEMVQTIGPLESLFAKSSSDALTIASEFLPGFVLLNMDLPELECYRLATMLHQRAPLCDSRLIALTTDVTSMDRRAALIAGFEQFLTLPLQQAALKSVLMGRSHRGPERSRIFGHGNLAES